MTKTMDSKTKIAIGNHDDYEEERMKGEKLKKSLMDHYNLNKPYYSFDYQNVHVLVMDTQLEMSVDTLESTAIVNETTTTTTDTKTKNLKEGKKESKKDKKEEPLLKRFPLVDLDDLLEQNSNSNSIEIPRKLEKLVESNAKVPALKVDNEQYQFVLDDLKKTSENKNIDWIFVMMHKPIYSSISKQLEEYLIRDKYQGVFDKYSVDVVLQGHNHIYTRTFPLSLNPSNIAQPIVDKIGNNNNTTFTNPNGTIFLVVGTGGEELHRIVEESYYVANQYNKGFGFVDLKIDGKRLNGVFYDINLNCNMEIITKKGREVIDFESYLPPPTIGNNELKVIDHFNINK